MIADENHHLSTNDIPALQICVSYDGNEADLKANLQEFLTIGLAEKTFVDGDNFIAEWYKLDQDEAIAKFPLIIEAMKKGKTNGIEVLETKVPVYFKRAISTYKQLAEKKPGLIEFECAIDPEVDNDSELLFQGKIEKKDLAKASAPAPEAPPSRQAGRAPAPAPQTGFASSTEILAAVLAALALGLF